MENINLVTKQDSGGLKTDMGLLVLFGIFLLTLATLGGMYFYGNSLDKQIAALDSQYTISFDGFVNGNVKPVLDYQNRLTIAGNLVKNDRPIVNDFAAVERVMVRGVFINSYHYDNTAGSIKLSCYADNYAMMAKQILSFKSSSDFSSVLAGESSYDAKVKKINFPVVITIKSQNI